MPTIRPARWPSQPPPRWRLLAALWPSIVIYVKRARDRGRSGWFVLLLFVPVLNIWALIEFLFLPGTMGDNAYGAAAG